jgi:hypothetical protein
MEVANLLGTTFEEVDMQWSPPQTQVEGLPTEGAKMPTPKADQKKKERCSKCRSTTHKTPQCTKRHRSKKCSMCGSNEHKSGFHRVLKTMDLPEVQENQDVCCQSREADPAEKEEGCLDLQLYGEQNLLSLDILNVLPELGLWD